MIDDLNIPYLQVTCFPNTNLQTIINSIRTCYDSFDKSDSKNTSLEGFILGEKDRELLDKLIFKHKHHSVIEHLVFIFKIQGISRLCLQELARHRIASFSVKSTRYTLKELKNVDIDKEWLKFIVPSGNEQIDRFNRLQLKSVQSMLGKVKTDVLKYLLPEAYRTSLTFTINARSLRNFFELRLNRSAHYEIRYLARRMLSEISEQFINTIFKDFKHLKLPFIQIPTSENIIAAFQIPKIDMSEGL